MRSQPKNESGKPYMVRSYMPLSSAVLLLFCMSSIPPKHQPEVPANLPEDSVVPKAGERRRHQMHEPRRRATRGRDQVCSSSAIGICQPRANLRGNVGLRSQSSGWNQSH